MATSRAREAMDSKKEDSDGAVSAAPETTRSTVVFFHPDLGIGGAERLVVDAAVGLQNLGHRVVIFTSYRDKGHCFDEARDGTLDVRVRGNVLPAMIAGRFKILLSILRHYHLLLQILWSGELKAFRPTAFFIDQLSAGIPFLRYLFPTVRILFYCHHPDLLLVQGREQWVRRIWRRPFDLLEGWTTAGADRVVANSEYTRDVARRVWPDLGASNGVGIVYPCVDSKISDKDAMRGFPRSWGGKKVVLSINRFEKKKGVGLAIEAFAKLDKKLREDSKLIIAGGYDSREPENVATHKELASLADSLKLSQVTGTELATASQDAEVVFLLSVPSQLKDMLLRSATLLVYTPVNEHFGIVPLEAMLAGAPVLASNTGGPRESVLDGVTGWLRDIEDVSAWADIIGKVLGDMPDAKLQEIGAAGRQRVREKFSKESMAIVLDEEIAAMQQRQRAEVWEVEDILLILGVVGAVALMVGSVIYARLLALQQRRQT